MKTITALSVAAALLLTTPALATSQPAATAPAMDHSMHMQHEPAAASPATSAGTSAAQPAPADMSTMPGMANPAANPASTEVENLPPPTDEPTTLVPAPETKSDDMAAMPGMDHSGHEAGMNDHSMAPLDPAKMPQAAPDRQGGTVLKSTDIDGLRIFELSAGELAWPLNDKTTVAAFAYNGQVPGPVIRVKAGEKIRINFTNNLKEPSTVHWHGVDVPVEMDGVPGISQDPVPPGGTFKYEFTVPNTPGTFFYHTHVMADKQQALGLSGAFIIDPATPPRTPAWDSEHTLVLSEWTVKDGGNVPSMPMEGMMPNNFTINGKSWPATERYTAKVGERVLLRVINAGAFAHPVHLHGAPFKVIATDGHPIPAAAQVTKDTIEVAPGERYDLLWTPTRPGTWMLHCHINHHTADTAQDDGMGGMMTVIDVTP